MLNAGQRLEIMTLFNDKDEEFFRWLQQVRQEDSGFRAWVEDDTLHASFTNAELSERFWQQQDELIQRFGQQHLSVGLDCGEGNVLEFDTALMPNSKNRRTPSTAMSKQLLSPWVRENKALWDSLSEKCTVAIHSASPGFNYINIQPFLNVEEILCKPSSELIGKPINWSGIPSAISECRERCIQRAIASGFAIDNYGMDWEGNYWAFQVESYYLPSQEQVLVRTIASDPDQDAYWRLFKKSKSRNEQ